MDQMLTDVVVMSHRYVSLSISNKKRFDFNLQNNANVNGLHPCTYVSDNVQVCIVEEGEEANADNCWTVENCVDPTKRQLTKFDNTVDNANAGAMAPTSVAGVVGMAGLFALFK